MEVVLGKEYLVKNAKDCVLVLVTSINGDSFDGYITYGYSIVNSDIINYNRKEQEEKEKYDNEYSELCEFLYEVDQYGDDRDEFIEQFIEENNSDLDFSDIASWDRIDSDKQVAKTFLKSDVIYQCSPVGSKIRIPFTSSISKEQVSLIMNLGFYLIDPFYYDSAIIHVDSEGVYYNVCDMIAICSRFNASFDPNDIIINGIIQPINDISKHSEEDIPIHFLMECCDSPFESEEHGHIFTINDEDFRILCD